MLIFVASLKALRDSAKLDKIEDNVIVEVKTGTKGVIKD